jgi:hypothetical protein
MKVLVTHDERGDIRNVAVPARESRPGAIRARLEATGGETFVELDVPDVTHDRLHEHLHDLRTRFSVRGGQLIPKASPT